MTETIIQEALERFKESDDATDFSRKAAYDDMNFARLADQWPDAIRQQRMDEGRPCLTINRLPAFIRQVVNDSRQNKPAITVHPVDNGADVQTAEVINGLIRSIERRSNADVAYDTAIDHSASGGFGFFQVGIEYSHDDSFDLECRIERIANPLMVHWDPSSTMFDASDWGFAFLSDFMSEDEFEAQYPKAAKVSWEGDTRDDAVRWTQEERVRVADYWLRESAPRKLLQLSNGMVMRSTEYVDEVKEVLEATGVTVLRERDVDAYVVKRRKISGVEVLEEETWPGSTIPICPVWGEEIVLDGRRHFRSMIRDAKDPQTMFNFWRSATTELVALAPRAPYIGPKGFTAGNEAAWATANNRSHPYLEYDPTAGGAPQRQPFAGIPAGALQEALNASDDMKSITGIYDSSLGARSNETSGRAIMARQKESDVSNFHFIDNLSRAIEYAGKVLVEIIPSVYNERQTIRILGDDMAEKVINLQSNDQGVASIETDEERLYDLSVGIYDVDVNVGPSYGTQREETREFLIEILRTVPDAAPLLGDVLMDHMDFVGADKVAKRLRTMLPPQVQQAEQEGNKVPPEVQAAMAAKDQELQQAQQQMQQLQQQGQEMMQQAQGALQKLTADLEAAKAQAASKDAEIASKAQIEMAKVQQAAAEADRMFTLKARELEIKMAEVEQRALNAALDREADLQKAMISKTAGQPTGHPA